MKSQKGITLISLTVYVIGMTLAISIITVISSYFYKNIDVKLEDVNPLTEYTKFNGFFTDEINSRDIRYLESDTKYNTENEVDSSFVAFNNGTQYTFIKQNKGIYRNKVKVCSDVESCKFEYNKKNNKDVIKVTMKIMNSQPREVEYTLRN